MREKLQTVIKNNCNYCSAAFFKELMPQQPLASQNLCDLTVGDLLRLITKAVVADLGHEEGAEIAAIAANLMEELQLDFFGCKPMRICDKHF